MQSTMNLLGKALEVQRAARWCSDLDVDPSTIAQAKKRGRLSPALAGTIAMTLGEEPEHWIAIAAMEAEPDSACKERMLKLFKSRVNR